jgi:BlaI family transcriptional regulator, penicillinase repressor
VEPAMPVARQLGALQLAILRVLWEREEATATEVHQALFDEHGLAPTTIATMLKKMEAKRLVTHRVDGRVFIYRASHERAAVEKSMLVEFIDRAFCGDSLALVNHLLDAGELDGRELSELKKRIAARKRTEGGAA